MDWKCPQMSLCPNLGTERFETNWKFAIVFSEGALRCKVSPKCKKLQPLILASFLLSSALRALDRRNLLCAKFLAKQSIHYRSAAFICCRYWQGLAGGWPGLQRGRRVGSAGHQGSPSWGRLSSPNPALLCLTKALKLKGVVFWIGSECCTLTLRFIA